MAGILQSRADDEHAVHYLHPGLMMLDLRRTPEPERVTFWPDQVEGLACDVGGHLWEHWRRHPGLRVRCFSLRRVAENDDMELFGETFLHYHGASDWDFRGPGHHARRTRRLIDMLSQVHRAGDESQGDLEARVVTPGALV
jgi:hypothetical protein